ncbi:MAG: hypothetical protein M3R71_04795, partial [Actinomycetota bacterium]|nr:hypothetical protein [Actinomycetota bacterium]
ILVGLVVWEWAPGRQVNISAATSPAARRSFYRPLLDQLTTRQSGPIRAEVVPARNHWEAASLAPQISLARGWERQLDLARNALFYRPGALTVASYQQWLTHNGVGWVALPTTPLDYAGKAEAVLLRSGTLPNLQLAWQSPQWQLWQVFGSPGILSGPGQLTALGPDHLTMYAGRPASFTIRVHPQPYWRVTSGAACVATTGDGWTELRVTRAGVVTLSAALGYYHAANCP